jgi:uncharacterized protein YjiS (DUF1127 family)
MLNLSLRCAHSTTISRREGKTAFIVCRLKRITVMAAIETTRSTAPFGAITTYRAIQSVSNVFGSMWAWNDARATRNALGKLSDRELDDIGLCRGDIEDISARPRS